MTVKALGPFILLMKSCLSLNDLLGKVNGEYMNKRHLVCKVLVFWLECDSLKKHFMTLILPSDKCMIGHSILNVIVCTDYFNMVRMWMNIIYW